MRRFQRGGGGYRKVKTTTEPIRLFNFGADSASGAARRTHQRRMSVSFFADSFLFISHDVAQDTGGFCERLQTSG